MPLPGPLSNPVVLPSGTPELHPLTTWHAALANRDNAPAKILCLGDSITEGTGAPSSVGRWVDRLGQGLRNLYPTNGLTTYGEGYVPAYNIAGLPARYTLGAGAVLGTVPPSGGVGASLGMGLKSFSLAGTAGATYTTTFTGTSFNLYYGAGSPTGFTITVDGGTAVSLSSSGAVINKQWNSGALTAGLHTIVITANNTVAVWIEGFEFFNGDELAGIHIGEAGYSGSTTFTWEQNQRALQRSQQAITFWNPDLVILSLGVNDHIANIAPVDYYNGIMNLIYAARQYTTKQISIVLVSFMARSDAAAQNPAYPYQIYRNTLANIAANDTGGPHGSTGIIWADLASTIPSSGLTGTGDPWGFISGDRVHPNARGHAYIADLLLPVITSR